MNPFSGREIAMLETFAQLAATTIQNSRLLDDVEARNRDLAEALEREQGTSDILRIIASSPVEAQTVLDAVCERAARLCGATDATIRLVEGEWLVAAARHGSLQSPTERILLATIEGGPVALALRGAAGLVRSRTF